MATKTFKIGEYCKGGVITAVATKDKVTIIAKDWDFSQGSTRGASQKNAKEFDRLEIDTNERKVYHTLYRYLTWLTSHGHAEKVLEWIENNTKLNNTVYFP